jgi:hypothetical protein
MANGHGLLPLQDAERLRRVADDVDGLAGRHDLQLHHKGKEIDHGAVAVVLIRLCPGSVRTPVVSIRGRRSRQIG